MKKTFRFVGLTLVAMVSFSFIGCGSDDDDDAVDTTPISMYAGTNKIIQGADTITSSNRFVAYANKNTLYGWHVGETSILVNGKKTISVTVSPKYYLYNDPICNWGCSMEYVKKNQKQGTVNSKSTNDILAYDDAGGATLLAYNFENNKLVSVLAMISTNHTSALGEYLSERYLLVPQYKGKNSYFAGLDGIDENNAKTMVLMDLYNTSNWCVYYTPFKKNSTRSNHSQEEIVELLRPLLK